MEGLFGPGALFEFDWRLALGDDPLTDDEMAALADATTPVIRLRDNWMIIDPLVARRARKRVAADSGSGPSRRSSRCSPRSPGRSTSTASRSRCTPARPCSRCATGSWMPRWSRRWTAPSGLAAPLRDYQRHGFTWLAELTGAGLGACLADDMGLGKTITLIALHLHRRERRLAHGPTLVVCPASLMGNWEAEIHRFAPGVAVRRFHGVRRGSRPRASSARRRVRAHHLRHHAPRPRGPRGSAVGPRRGRRGPAHQERDLLDRPQPAHHRVQVPGGAHRDAGREQPHRALGDPRLGHARAARLAQRLPQGLGRADRERGRPVRGPPVRPARRAVPAPPPQVRPRHRSRAAGEDRDRPPDRADPRAGRALRGARARVDGADRASRRGHPPRTGARAAHRPQADLQPPGPLPAPGQRPAQGPLGEARPVRRAARHDPVRERLGAASSPSTSPWRACSSDTSPRPPSRPCSCTAAPPSAPGSRWCATSRTAPRRCSCSR